MSVLKECLTSLCPVYVKNTFLDMEDASLQADPRRSASEPPRHRHHGYATLPKSFACVDTASYDSGSTGYGSPRGSVANDSVSDEGSRSGSEWGDISFLIPNSPVCPLPLNLGEACKPQLYHSPALIGNASPMPKSGLHQRKNTTDNRISIFSALQSPLQEAGILQSKQNLLMTRGDSVFEYKASTTCSVEFSTGHQKRAEAGTSHGVSRNSENPPLKAFKGKKGKDGPRTLMICNLPCRITYDDLIEAINSVGFGEAFEFVHVACRFKQPDSNLGYAFINFFSPADAARFASTFEGYHFSHKGSTKACTVKIAKSQGFNGSYRRVQRNLRLAQSP